jgi:hypothetical protein
VLGFSNTPARNHGVAEELISGKINEEVSRIYWNKGDGTFEDRTEALGMNTVLMSMGSNYGDLNGDGWLEFFVGVGNPDLTALFPNRMFLSQEGKRFEDVTMDGAFGHLQKGHAIVFADLDNDGDQDVYENIGGALETDFFQNALFENPGFGNNWVTLRMEGKESNRDAVGARLKLTLRDSTGATRELHRHISSGPSFGGSSYQEEIGLGKADTIAQIEIFWPRTGKTQRINGLPKNRILRIVEGESTWREENVPAFIFGGAKAPVSGADTLMLSSESANNPHQGHQH